MPTGVLARDLIQDAVEKIGVYAAGETMSDADSSRALIVLNDMMDSWSNESLAVYANQEQHMTLVPGKFAYTIGPGGDIAGTRPLNIIDEPGSAWVLDPNGNRYPISIKQQWEWDLIGNVSQNVTSNIPDILFYNPQFPLGIINVFPTPAIGWDLYFLSRIQLSDFDSLFAPISLPPGYAKAIKDNLAEWLWPYFKPDGSDVPVGIVRAAARTKAVVKRMNARPNVALYDKEMISKAKSTYNIYRDASSFY